MLNGGAQDQGKSRGLLLPLQNNTYMFACTICVPVATNSFAQFQEKVFPLLPSAFLV